MLAVLAAQFDVGKVAAAARAGLEHFAGIEELEKIDEVGGRREHRAAVAAGAEIEAAEERLPVGNRARLALVANGGLENRVLVLTRQRGHAGLVERRRVLAPQRQRRRVHLGGARVDLARPHVAERRDLARQRWRTHCRDLLRRMRDLGHRQRVGSVVRDPQDPLIGLEIRLLRRVQGDGWMRTR